MNETGQTARNNCFDLLRLLAALMVLVTHQYGVLKADGIWPLGIIGAWGVDIFFAISGYLNGHSLMARRSVPVFLVSRALRLYPALIFCVVAMVVLGAAITTHSLGDYFGSRVTWDFLWRNSALFSGQRMLLPGVFETNPIPGLNGSLWTLPIEARFYLYLAAAIFVARYMPLAVAAALAAGFVVIVFLGDVNYEQPTQRFLMTFGCGIFIAAVERWRGARLALAIVAAASIVVYLFGQLTTTQLLFTALAAIIAGRLEAPSWLHIKLDFSYGFYLFAFPIQQLTAQWGLSLLLGMAVSTVATAVMAIISAMWVEAPALRLAQHFKRQREPAPRDRTSAAA